MKLIVILGFAFISVIGTLLHFVYDKTNHNKVAGIFGAVNESTWEHIKMGLTPAFLWCIVDGCFFGSNINYFFAKLLSLLVLIVTIPTIFYGYKKISKKPILIIDIATFFIAIALSQITFYWILNINPIPYPLVYASVIILFILFGFYLLLTIFPIKSFLFQDPITKKYGISGHSDIKKSSKK